MDDHAIIKLFEKQHNDIKDIIESNSVVIRGVIRSEVDRIDEMDKKRNGTIKDLLYETTVWRWVQRNYKIAVPGILLLLMLFIKGADRIDAKSLFENTTGIEIVDE